MCSSDLAAPGSGRRHVLSGRSRGGRRARGTVSFGGRGTYGPLVSQPHIRLTLHQPHATLTALFSNAKVQIDAIPRHVIKLPSQPTPPLLNLLAAAEPGHSERQIQHGKGFWASVLEAPREQFPTLHYGNEQVLELKQTKINP